MSITIADLQFLDVEPPVLDAHSPATTVWHDGERGPVAFAATLGPWHWLRIAGVGSYRFPVDPPGTRVECGVVPEDGASHALVVDSYYRSIVPTALQAYGCETLHGSAVALPGGVVAMCADRETGKSTIAFALQRRGHGAVADDAVVVSVPPPAAVGRVTVRPLPFALRLRHPSARHFDAPGKDRVLVDADSEPGAGADLDLAAIVMLARHAGPVELTRLSAAEAFSSVLAQAYAFSLTDDRRKRAMVSGYMRLVNLVPTYRLRFPSGLEHLTDICERIERLAVTSAEE